MADGALTFFSIFLSNKCSECAHIGHDIFFSGNCLKRFSCSNLIFRNLTFEFTLKSVFISFTKRKLNSTIVEKV